MKEADPHKRIQGAVLYETAGEAQEEWAVPIATTIAAQQALLPVTAAIRAKHPCLASLAVVTDLTKNTAMASADTAWEWAFTNLLPHASKTVAYNLYHTAPAIHTDPQSNATLANVDWAVQQKAFIMNFKTGNAVATEVNPLFSKALASMEPLFSLYGWADNEFSLVWMTESSGAGPDGTKNSTAAGGGGAVFCSFATPNLSFWKLLGLPNGQTKARPLPVYDRKMKYDKTKKYVLMETNEGDTPRIVVSAFSKSWTDPRRGTLPISWAIDPQLGEEFPALFDYFSQTAGVNDSFISGPGGCGYVYYGRMTDPQIRSFAKRCGRLMKDYGPAVIDTFGQTSAVSNAGADSPQDQTVSLLQNFSKYAAEGGVAPQMYISQPTGVIKYAYHACDQAKLDVWTADGTPIVCTASSGVFYVMPSIGGGKQLAQHINTVAGNGTQFITTYGGLRWTTTTSNSKNDNLYTFWGDTIANLNDDIIAVGAQEMARLAREAHAEYIGVHRSTAAAGMQ